MKTEKLHNKSLLYIALTFIVSLVFVFPVSTIPKTAQAQLGGKGLSDGTFFRLMSDPNKVFFIDGGSKRQLPFPSDEVMACLGLDPKIIVDGTAAEEDLPVGQGYFCNPKNGIEPLNGDLISGLPDSDVTGIYLVENGTRRPFPSNAVFDCLGYSYSNIHIANTTAVDLPIGEGMTCGDPAFGLTCGVNQTVTKGQDAYFPIQIIYSTADPSQDISVAMDSVPFGPVMSNSPLSFTPSGPNTNNAIISTGSSDPGTYTLTFTGTAKGITRTCSSNLTIQGLAPFVDIKFNGSDGPTMPNPSNGSDGQISWTTTDANTCTAAGAKDWDGDKGVANGKEQVATVGNLQIGNTYTYSLTCTSVDGVTAIDSVEVSVGDPLPPTADFYCEGDLPNKDGAGYCAVSDGSAALLFFSSAYTTSCSLSPAIPDYKPGTQEKVGVSTGPLSSPPGQVIYDLNCDGPGGKIQKTVHINVGASSQRSVDIKCTGTDGKTTDGPCVVEKGASVTLTWTSTNCGPLSIDPGVGSVDYDNIKEGLGEIVNKDTTFTINCPPVVGDGMTIMDSVVVNVNPSTPVATANCAPSPITLTKGGAPGVITVDVSVTNYNGSTLSVYPSWEDVAPVDYPTFSYENNPLKEPGVSSVILTTYNTTTTGTFPLKIIVSGEGITSAICFVTVIVNGDSPKPPENVQASTAGDCGTVTISWTRPSTGPVPDSYQIYRLVYPQNSEQKWKSYFAAYGPPIIDSGISDGKFSFTDKEPLYPENSNFYAIKSILGSLSSDFAEANPAIPLACAASLSQSDKDLYQVANNTGAPTSCNNVSDTFTLPNQTIFKAGSRVYFHINVCNTGSKPLTGLRVTESNYQNLTDFKLEGSSSRSGDCVIKDSGDGTYYLADLDPAQLGYLGIPLCTLNISATIATPKTTGGYLSRFWNQATIYSNELDPKVVTTPPYLYSNGGSDVIPTRGESAP